MVEHSSERYRFRAIQDQLRLSGTGKILSGFSFAPGSFDVRAYQECRAHFRGSLFSLFGEPATKSRLSDEAFSYVIEAWDDTGHSWTLSAYSGASGPAIGGPTFDPSSEAPARALLALIESASPADFEAVIYDDDTDNTVKYGIRKGQYYYEERRGKHLEE